MDTISFIGSGHVATHLAKAFYACGYPITGVCSRTLVHAHKLAAQVNAKAVNQIENLPPTKVYIIAVDDRSVAQVAQQLQAGESLVLHTAGAVPLSVLQKFPNHGILYPLQTLGRSSGVELRTVPFFIEANIQKNFDSIQHLAESLSDEVHPLDSEGRARLHLAAVFSGNFINTLLAVAYDISGADFAYLKPLVQETVKRAFAAKHPADVQTGPARRGDENSISKHLELLTEHPEWQAIYRLLTDNIIKQAAHARL